MPDGDDWRRLSFACSINMYGKTERVQKKKKVDDVVREETSALSTARLFVRVTVFPMTAEGWHAGIHQSASLHISRSLRKVHANLESA